MGDMGCVSLGIPAIQGKGIGFHILDQPDRMVRFDHSLVGVEQRVILMLVYKEAARHMLANLLHDGSVFSFNSKFFSNMLGSSLRQRAEIQKHH